MHQRKASQIEPTAPISLFKAVHNDVKILTLSLFRNSNRVHIAYRVYGEQNDILLDNEKIDQTLEDLIVLSLSSLKGVKDVKIKINNEDVRTKKTSIIEYNFIKI